MPDTRPADLVAEPERYLAAVAAFRARAASRTGVGSEVAGQRGDEAQTLIGTYGCTPGTVRPMHSQTVPQGQVVSQEQAEGTMLPPRSRVDFAVSLGPRPCRVPPVRGRKLSVARAAITRRACRVGKVTRVRSQKVKRGRVVSQSPRPGTALPNLGKVNLVVSRGPTR